MQALGWGDGQGNDDRIGLGQQRTQENLDERLIEDWRRRRMWSCHDRVAEATLRAMVVTDSSDGRRHRVVRDTGTTGSVGGEGLSDYI